jgi:stringent starvation protein B
MSEQSAKPYLIRAICEWCADNGLTPYLAVKVNGQTRVPAAYVKNGEIVLNISAGATRRLTIDNERVQFTARFNGVSQEVSVPVPAVSGIFAKETGYGFAFTVAADPAASLDAATAPAESAKPPDDKPRGRPKHLQVVKWRGAARRKPATTSPAAALWHASRPA